MITRPQFLWYRAQCETLGQYIFEFEATNKEYNFWLDFKRMSYDEQARIRKAWAEYYEKCSESREAKLYRRAATALREHKMSIVKECAELARIRFIEGKPSIQAPLGFDPDTIEKSLQNYFRTKEKLQQFEDIVKEYAPVYGKRGEFDNLL